MNRTDGHVHNQMAELLSAYIDGEVSTAERTLVERHLAVCPTCARDLATLRQTVQLLRQLPAVPAPRALTLRESQVRPARPAVWRWLLGAPALAGGVAALLCVIAVGGVMLLGRITPDAGEVQLALAPPPATAPAEPPGQATTAESVFVESTEPVEPAPVTDVVSPESTLPPAPVEVQPPSADEFNAAGSQPITEMAPIEEPMPVAPPADVAPAPAAPPATHTAAPEVVVPSPADAAAPPTSTPSPADVATTVAPEAAPQVVVVPATEPTEEPAVGPALKVTTDETPAAAARAAEVTPTTPAESAATDIPEPTATATPEPTATDTPEPPATATPEPTTTDTPEPTATETPEPPATATPEPTATDTPEPTATETPEPSATATPEPTATDTPEAPASVARDEVDEVTAPEAAETVEASTPAAAAEEPGVAPATPVAEATPTPVLMAVEELQLSVKPGLIRVGGRLPLPEGQHIRAGLWRADQRLEWSMADAEDEGVMVEAEGRFNLVLHAQPDKPDYDLFAVAPAKYEVRIVPVEPPAAFEARVPFDTFPPPTQEP